MNYIILLLLIIVISCGYPDVDTVPGFENVNISRDESIDLCKLTNADNESISECIDNID